MHSKDQLLKTVDVSRLKYPASCDSQRAGQERVNLGHIDWDKHFADREQIQTQKNLGFRPVGVADPRNYMPRWSNTGGCIAMTGLNIEEKVRLELFEKLTFG